MTSRLPHLGFVLERSLGHRAHAETLARLLPLESTVVAEVAQIDYAVEGAASKVPLFATNWTVRAGVRARRAIRRMHRASPLDALFVHTQVSAVLSPDWLRRLPTIVSLDATPLQYDELGAHYGHEVGNRHVEKIKWDATRACFRRAHHIVAWSAWAKDGVVDGYRIDAGKITVLPPGVDRALWRRSTPRRSHDGPLRLLFVGGDLERKGGDVLVDAFRSLREEPSNSGLRPDIELDMVTNVDLAPSPGLRVHRHLTPNSPELIALFHAADIFVLPTRGDCLGIALVEAGAAELPLVSTAIAGVPEIVRDGETGLVVRPGDRVALVSVLRELIERPELRQRLGASARALVDQRFDAAANTHRLVEMLLDAADSRASNE